jgi:CDP-4-dehydro-6-deoxyglucose reductase, E3
MNKVTIKNSGHSFDVRPSQTVLQAAIEAGINLPYGCRNGACGSCKAKLITGKVMHNDYQSSAMSDADLAAGNTLLCCAMALEDLTVECREVVLNRAFYPHAWPKKNGWRTMCWRCTYNCQPQIDYNF